MAWVMYNSALKETDDGTINLDDDTFYLMLAQSGYTPNVNTHAKRSDITNEVSGGNYPAGGVEIENTSVVQDNDNNRSRWLGDDVTIGSEITATFRYAVIYKRRGGAASADELVCYNDFTSDQSVTAGPAVIRFTGNHIITKAMAT